MGISSEPMWTRCGALVIASMPMMWRIDANDVARWPVHRWFNFYSFKPRTIGIQTQGLPSTLRSSDLQQSELVVLRHQIYMTRVMHVYVSAIDGVSTIDFDPNLLHMRYASMLWHYGSRKEEETAQSVDEAPMRPPRDIGITDRSA
ncbi:hypothetical protein FXO38_19543 [Capsicum annuum]|nr:hypothetical protein FXO38_19543 [Capsicum annuum]KAF3669227.1 hypothetical protein FXO37_09147 [Capsicum annuum]